MALSLFIMWFIVGALNLVAGYLILKLDRTPWIAATNLGTSVLNFVLGLVHLVIFVTT